jgi:hypothetical protein
MTVAIIDLCIDVNVILLDVLKAIIYLCEFSLCLYRNQVKSYKSV